MIPQDILDELGFLHEQTSQIRGWTPLDDPRRALVDDFCKVVLRTIEDHGVTVWEVSVALGLSRSTLALKLGRYGYRPLPPSQTATTSTGDRARKKKTVCKRGHDIASEGTRNPSGRCKECVRWHDKNRTRT